MCVSVQALRSGNQAFRFLRRGVRGFTIAINTLDVVSPLIFILRESQGVSVTGLATLAYSPAGRSVMNIATSDPTPLLQSKKNSQKGKLIFTSVSPWQPDFLCPHRQHCCSKSPELSFFSLTSGIEFSLVFSVTSGHLCFILFTVIVSICSVMLLLGQ